jgi:hypothetical protein
MGKEFKRMRYFDGLFLNAEDYNLDQNYQRRLQQLHNRYLHTWGIITGLEVKPVEGTTMKVAVSEGLALNQVVAEDNGESISQEIMIYDEHPDNPLDLSGYTAAESIYITVGYEETPADADDIEKGKGNEIHVWERGCIRHSRYKPEDPEENIILARVVPISVQREITNQDGSKTVINETLIDNTCIFDTDYDGSQLRIYAGPAGRTLSLEKLIVRMGEEIADMPYIKALDEGAEGIGLEVKSPSTKFTGSVDIKGDLVVHGELTMDSGGDTESELLVSNSYVQVNSPTESEQWQLRDGGLEVYRGGTSENPDARILWSESEKKWKVGVGNQLSNIAYGPLWERLIKNDVTDDLHRHTQLSSIAGTALSVDNSGNLSVNGDMAMKDKTVWLRSSDDNGHGIGWFGVGKPFAGVNVDGPVLFGLSGGILGTTQGGQKSVLSWNNIGNVGIGTLNPKDDKLDVAGSLRILSGSNPVRFTSSWTSFPGSTINQAEISNDTTNYKALMIVGNQSAGQGRKVAIWDRLDVNGFLYVNGNMQVTQAITPSAGSGNNGIVFPRDPGGGSGDAAWLKYYPRWGESCTLEIGTSNDWDDNISLMASGNVGIGTRTPSDKLDVSGWVRIMSGSNPIRFTSQWTGFPESAVNNAEISNDTTNYKTLMIVGNKSGGQGRKVSIWDRLDVNGFLQVNGSMQVNGAITPSVGNSENNGIMFPKDAYGGTGDAAWIRYYSDTSRGGGENMTLEIGIANDSGYWYNGGDRIRLHASGGVYVDGYFYYSSSREYKENITGLPVQRAKQVLDGLNPVTFNFKGDTEKVVMGFIAEEVPQEVSAHDNKAISPLEIIAALTSVVKDQRKTITKLQQQIEALPGANK